MWRKYHQRPVEREFILLIYCCFVTTRVLFEAFYAAGLGLSPTILSTEATSFLRTKFCYRIKGMTINAINSLSAKIHMIRRL